MNKYVTYSWFFVGLLLPSCKSQKFSTVQNFERYGLVEVKKLSPSIVVDLKYATPDNFAGEVVYLDFNQAFLIKDVAERLAKVQHYIDSIKPGYKIHIYDAARPFSVQKRFLKS